MSSNFDFIASKVEEGRQQVIAQSQAYSSQTSEKIKQENRIGAQNLEQKAKGYSSDAVKVTIRGVKPSTEPALPNMSPYLREYLRVKSS